MSRDEASESNTELADALRAVAKQLQEMSELLLPAVASIADAVKQKENDENDSEVKAEATEEELWETTRDTIKDEDQVQIDSWKDELNNLLVFAGLFSAVVTAFTVESYTWLQQDPGDATNMFLAYISLQISSFTNTPPFINSSAPALPIQNVTSAFTPATIAVPVNTLWVLSLTVSLISAFFAIAVQQWLRQLRLPLDIPARRAAQLAALRSDGLKMWQVPGIISLLPLLLQMAVVLFLVGLFVLLRSLNATVAIAFGIVAALGLMAFLASAFIPLLSARCPYKSPLVPTALIVLQWLSYPVTVMGAAVLLPLNIALQSSAGQYITYHISYRVGRFFYWDFDIWCTALLAYIRSFGRHMFVDMGEFWLRREYQHLSTLDDNTSSRLGRSSVARALLVCSNSSFTGLIASMRCFSSYEWRGVSRAMVMHSLNIFLPGFYFHNLVDLYGNIAPRAASYVQHWLSSRHSDLLRNAQEARDWKQNGRLSGEDREDLVLSSELEKYGSERYTQHVKHLFHICDDQTTYEVNCWPEDSIIPLLLLKAFNAGYAPDVDEARIVVSFASKHGTHSVILQYPRDSDSHRMLFASCTAALVSMTHHPSVLQEEGRQLLSVFSDILLGYQWKTNHKSMLEAFYTSRPEDGFVRAFPQMPGIHRTLCRTLVELAEKGVLLRDSACPSIPLASTLREIYEGINKEDINDARVHLDIFSQRIHNHEYLGRWEQKPARLQDQQEASVSSKDDAMPARAPFLDMPPDGDHSHEYDELPPCEGAREASGSLNAPSPDTADIEREIEAENHERISAELARMSIAEDIGILAETHADHAPALAPMTSGCGGMQREQDALDTVVTQPATTDDLVIPQMTAQVVSSPALDEQDNEGDNHRGLIQPAHVTASSQFQPPRDPQTLKLPHSASKASLPDDSSTISAKPMSSLAGPPVATASSPSDAIDDADFSMQNTDSHDAMRVHELNFELASEESTTTDHNSSQPDAPQVLSQLGILTSPLSDIQPANSGSADSAAGAVLGLHLCVYASCNNASSL